MISRKLAKQFDSLKAIKPRTEWKDRTREILLAQITAQEKAGQQHFPIVGITIAYLRGAVIASYRQTAEQLFARPLALSGVLSAVVVGAVSIVIASQGSIPGDPLYTVKRTEESVRVAFVSPTERPALQLDLATKRLRELSKLAERTLSADEKTEQTTFLTQEADASISTAQKELIRVTKETPEKAVYVAAQLKENAVKSKEQAQKISNEPDTPALAGVIARLDETRGAALQVIVEKKDASQTSDGEVAAHLEEAIFELEERLARLSRVRAAGFQGDTAEKAVEVTTALQEARASVKRNDFSIALSSINQSRKIIIEGEKQLSKNGDAANDGEGLK